MTQLTPEQYEFLKKHLESYEDPYDVIFDATGMGPSIYIPIMKSLDKFIAIKTNPCTKGGHTMKYKRLCIQCNPSCFHYRRIHRKKGYVYIAASESTKLYKIGCTKDIKDRETHLNNNYYGGLQDRKMIHYIKCNEAGRIENLIHRELKNHKAERYYLSWGKNINCKELFKGDYEIIKSNFDKIINTL